MSLTNEMTAPNGAADPGSVVGEAHDVEAAEAGLADIGSPEAQLVALYAERDLLQRELGTSDAEEIVARFAERQAAADQGYEPQLVALYAERDLLQRELGTVDAREIVARVRRLERRLDAVTNALTGLTAILEDIT